MGRSLEYAASIGSFETWRKVGSKIWLTPEILRTFRMVSMTASTSPFMLSGQAGHRLILEDGPEIPTDEAEKDDNGDDLSQRLSPKRNELNRHK
jgi:hypothetical protein